MSAMDLRRYVTAGKQGTRAQARHMHGGRGAAGTRGGRGVDGTGRVGMCQGARRRAQGTGTTCGGGQTRAEGAQSQGKA